MKYLKSINFFLMIGLLTSFCHTTDTNAAMSEQDFLLALQQDKVPAAIQTALAEGMSVDDIIKQALTLEGMNPRQILTALCKKGANSRDITQAASQNGISALIIAAASEECQNEESDTQAYTAARERTRNIVPAVVRQRTGPAEPYVSPSTFQ